MSEGKKEEIVKIVPKHKGLISSVRKKEIELKDARNSISNMTDFQLFGRMKPSAEQAKAIRNKISLALSDEYQLGEGKKKDDGNIIASDLLAIINSRVDDINSAEKLRKKGAKSKEIDKEGQEGSPGYTAIEIRKNGVARYYRIPKGCDISTINGNVSCAFNGEKVILEEISEEVANEIEITISSSSVNFYGLLKSFWKFLKKR